MTIEIHSPNLQVNEKLIDSIKKKILELSHLRENISRVEIFLKEQTEVVPSKSCEIRLDIFGDTLFVHKQGKSFEQGVMRAIRTLRKILKKKLETHNQLPNDVTSTVKI